MTVKRADRVGPLICEEVAITLQKLDNPHLVGVTITRVKMTADLRVARVFFSLIGDEEKITRARNGLISARGIFRRALRENLDLRYLPELEFQYDKNLEHADRIDQLLRELHKNAAGGEENEP